MGAPLNGIVRWCGARLRELPGARIALISKIITISEWSRTHAQLTQCEIGQFELHALLALPTVDCNLASCVQNATAIFDKRLTDRLTSSTESNRVHEFSVADRKRARMWFSPTVSHKQAYAPGEPAWVPDCPHHRVRHGPGDRQATRVKPPAATAPSISSARSRRAASTGPANLSSRKARKAPSAPFLA